MTKRIIFRPKASQDLDDQFAYIAEDDLEAAFRFFDAARLTMAQIARMPGMGSPYPVTNPRLQGIRKWAVKGFRKHLIFYCDRDDAVEIVRILSATRDTSSILESEV
jgi:toxin ParE1/3/4